MQNLNAGDLVSYNSSSQQLQIGGSFDNCTIPYPQYWDTHHYYYHQYYPSLYIPEKSKIEQAFRIIGKLIEKKIIEKELTVKEFMKMVNDIAEVI